MEVPYKIDPQDDQTMNPDDWNQADEYMLSEDEYIYMKNDPVHILSMAGFELYNLEQMLSEDMYRVDIKSAINSAQRGIAQAIDMIEERKINVKTKI